MIEIFRPLADRYAILILEKFGKMVDTITPTIKKECISVSKHILVFLTQEQEFSVAIKGFIFSYISVLNKTSKKIIFPKYNYDFTL